jgi:nucleotide-binding universal stress UspA family protein
MAPLHTILHPTDFSPRSEFALQLACALTRDYGARLIVLHVATPPPLVYGEGLLIDSQEAFQDAKERLARLQLPDDNVRAERRFESGDPATEILRVADEIHADLIVVGTHGRSGVGRLLMGSTAEQIVRQAPCPVLTLKMPMAATVAVPDARAEAIPHEVLA